jgi:hypothetical protein
MFVDSKKNRGHVSIFLNENNQLRSGWKFIAYVVFFLIIWIATGVALSILVAGRNTALFENQLVILALNEIALFIPAGPCGSASAHRPSVLSNFRRRFLPSGAQNSSWTRAVAGMLAVLTVATFGYVRIIDRTGSSH